MLLPRSSHVIRAVENASTNLLAIAGRKSRSRDFSTVAAVLKNRAILEVRLVFRRRVLGRGPVSVIAGWYYRNDVGLQLV